MNYIIDKTQRPAYLQLYRMLRQDILDGLYPPGSRLPSRRLLAEETGLSTVTVEHAYELLCEEGYAESRERSGYFCIFRAGEEYVVSEGRRPLPEETKNTDSVETYFPFSRMSRVMRRVLAERGDKLLMRSASTGLPELREALRSYLARNRGIHAESGQIIVGAGAEYLYGQILALLGPGHIYALENPAYEKLEQILQAAGVQIRLLPLERDGISSAALFSTDADVLLTTPFRSFPSGVTAPASKRHEYIRWASESGRLLIESDHDSEFSVAAKPVETLFALSGGSRVIYLNTFSRTISPALRAAYMVLPRELVEEYVSKLGFYSCTVPVFEQLVITELLNSGDFERHVNRVRRQMRRRAEDEKKEL